jgi:hypothetical protein
MKSLFYIFTVNRDQPKNELNQPKMNRISQIEPGSAEFALRVGAFFKSKLKELIVMEL